MSSKSKKSRSHRHNMADARNQMLCVMLWAIVNVIHPTNDQLQAVSDEIGNVIESVRTGRLKMNDILDQLRDEYDIITDWTRRDRSHG